MNKRLLHLFNEAGFHQPEMERLGIEHKFEKFAELIVKECARVIDRGDGVMSSMDETIWCNVCRDDILKHFGVEE
jgi:hypothetical protein